MDPLKIETAEDKQQVFSPENPDFDKLKQLSHETKISNATAIRDGVHETDSRGE